ncbi:hypothetical protein [Actinophytocola algeriensis]|uniref:Uncharacterized protein n=1 Tax=Actinophytocola algeriensis TaxID=1768010 RepID=A0A7W7VD00_9PSEU|nr:hypothetical protein [Actinophytocola algeriensis]MBB4905475.1 hypothetical protein [Actinophytocola algeriensis]MBE1472840.1 hypothetical protein [Actinophytocola algeriensis]
MKRTRPTSLEAEFLRAVKRQRAEDDENYSSPSQSVDSDDSGDSQSQSYDSESEDAPDPTLIVAGPRIQIAAVGGIANIRYLVDPAYTPAARPGAGGAQSTVVLGPGGYVSMNSDADRTAIPAILAAETDHPGHTFKAGHLLNAELGGSGSDPDNLIILTTAANNAQRAFDDPIKASIQTTLTHAYTAMNNMGLDVTTIGYGISLTITANASYWSNNPAHGGYAVPDGFTCTAAVVGEPVPAHLEAALTGLYGPTRVANHANLKATLNRHIANLQNEVAAANLGGTIVQ